MCQAVSGLAPFRPELRSAGMDTRIGKQLIEVGEPGDVADLGEQGRGDRRADARDRLEPPGGLAVEEARDPAIGSLDLALEQVVLVEQEVNLEGDLGVELGDRDRVGRGGLESLGLRPAQPSMAGSGVRIGQAWTSVGASPPGGRERCAGSRGRSGRSDRRTARRAPGSRARPGG